MIGVGCPIFGSPVRRAITGKMTGAEALRAANVLAQVAQDNLG